VSRLRANDPVRVSLGACECPDKPHEEDEAFIRARLRTEDAMSVLTVIGEGDPDIASMGRQLGRIFIAGGLLSWNILDDDGDEIPISEALGDALDWQSTMLPIANAAADLYTPQVLHPLQTTPRKRSKRGQTKRSTSPRSPSS